MYGELILKYRKFEGISGLIYYIRFSMTVISIPILLVALCCPFLIFLDFHKRDNVYIAVIYVFVFFTVIFLTYKFIYHYGMFLTGITPFLVLFLCIIKKKR